MYCSATSGDMDEVMLWNRALSASGLCAFTQATVIACSPTCVVAEIRTIYEWSNSSACVCELIRAGGVVAYDCSNRGLTDIPACVTNDATLL